MINIALLGCGNVGKAVVDTFVKKSHFITERVGREIKIKTILVRDLSKKREFQSNGITATDSIESILNDNDITIVVELMGGENPAFDYMLSALKAKKTVVTANKEVIAKHINVLSQTAKENGVDIYFEAAVGGGIPLIRTLKIGLASNKVLSLHGILNGTTNYILTKIEEEKKDFDIILKNAQTLGFAESDPTMDISGLDAVYKLIILTAVAFKSSVKIKDISYSGIENITLADIDYAKELGFSIKLLATAKLIQEKLYLTVQPTLIPLSHPLTSVRNEVNAIYVTGDDVGEVLLSGKGAGGYPTGSAVVSDIIDGVFSINEKISRRNLEHNSHSILKICDTAEVESAYYLRMIVPDSPGVLENITKVFHQNAINIAKIIQKSASFNEAEIILSTHPIKQKHINNSISKLKEYKIKNCLRIGLID